MIEVYRSFTSKVSYALLLISLLVFIGNVFIYFIYFNFSKPINANVDDEGTISLIVESTSSTPSPSPSPSPGSSSGGGGGGSSADTKKKSYDFSVDQILIKVSSKVGETYKQAFKISNPNDISMTFEVSDNLNDFLFISESNFEIPAKSERIIYFTFVATSETEPDVYTGKVLVKSQYSSKEIPVIYEVNSKRVLFDVSVNIPAKYRNLNRGDDLFFQVNLLNLGEIGKVDVLLEYAIKDLEDKLIMKSSDSVAVETRASFSKEIVLPINIKDGDYVIFVVAKYGDSVSTSSNLFSVGKKDFPAVWFWFSFVIFLFICFVLIVIYERRHRKLRFVLKEQNSELIGLRRKIHSGKMKVAEAIIGIRKLQVQKALLEQAYKQGYLKEDSYNSSRRKIDSMSKDLKEKYL